MDSDKLQKMKEAAGYARDSAVYSMAARDFQRLATPAAVLELISEVERRGELISDMQHHYMNGARNNATFMTDWLRRAAER